jgi:hypothetical protein
MEHHTSIGFQVLDDEPTFALRRPIRDEVAYDAVLKLREYLGCSGPVGREQHLVYPV